MKTPQQKKLDDIIAKKFTTGNCPRCGVKVMILKDEYKDVVTPVDKKYRGICNGCITPEEHEEIFTEKAKYREKLKVKSRLKVIK